ncbi:PREDICTED: vacuolar iron transporter homolog 2-like isoform X3 [Erythranthe guttata]|uniref:vacuolar iron transporter homolog 2-like isoform X3 n=1 Tax=Erythranthe guttata TaxID=4155 RepID=UPI00064DFD1D|nr:PREDICTED: vacuolar iron transporter homolog 2-like isoform X3 [Erythranthe guttata]|eukprot:XP_012853907.1 PREDICTED: vacuolar iron transporter homolog 2-like isoform X3 [Erythranthe guttata]
MSVSRLEIHTPPPELIMAAGAEIKLSVNSNNNNNNNTEDEEEKRVNLIQRAQWLRAAILGANDGLLSTTSLMLGVGGAKEDERLMIISGLAGAIAGAFSMAVGEFVSVSTQRDIEHATTTTTTTDIHKCINDNDKSIKPREISMPVDHEPSTDTQTNNPLLPNPYKAAGASGLAFLCGSLVPLLSGMLIPGYKTRAVGIVLVTSVALVIFGGAGARLGGRSSVRISALRVLFGGWISMAFTYGFLKALDTDRKGHDSD